MTSAFKILPRYTYDDYCHWEGNWELIEGIPYAISPLPIPKHQAIANNLGAELRFALKKCKACKSYQPIDYKISEETVVGPDLLVVCGEITKKFLDFPPQLIAEILSPATEFKDRYTKFELYQQQKIKYYLLISPEAEEVEIYLLQNDAYKLDKKGRNFVYTFDFSECAAIIDFAEVFENT
jgi:Uma2 family endonuclease